MAGNQTIRGPNAKFWSCPENQPEHLSKGAWFVPHGLSISQEGRRQAVGGISAKQPRPSENGRLRGRGRLLRFHLAFLEFRVVFCSLVLVLMAETKRDHFGGSLSLESGWLEHLSLPVVVVWWRQSLPPAGTSDDRSSRVHWDWAGAELCTASSSSATFRPVTRLPHPQATPPRPIAGTSEIFKSRSLGSLS